MLCALPAYSEAVVGRLVVADDPCGPGSTSGVVAPGEESERAVVALRIYLLLPPRSLR